MTDRRIAIVGPGRVTVEEVQPEAPPAGWVRIRVAHAGICGSDLHTYRRGHPWRPYPIRPGHEASGAVDAVGDGVQSLRDSDPVYVFPELPCGACPYCARGLQNLCERPGGVGGSIPGAMADRVLVPGGCARPVPGGVSLAAASMIEPLAAAVRAVRRAGGVTGRSVVVLGAGTIGQMTVLASRLQGSERIVATDVVESKRRAARRMGADAAVDAGSSQVADEIVRALGPPPRVVFDCVAVPASLSMALRLAQRAGTVVVVGAPADAALRVDVAALHHGEVTLTGSEAYVASDFAEAERLVSEGAPVEELITCRFALADAAAAFAAASTGEQVKVQFTPEDG